MYKRQTHAWYVGYAPLDNPQIAVAVFIFNGGEGSLWAAPGACHVMAAYFRAGQDAGPVVPAAGAGGEGVSLIHI